MAVLYPPDVTYLPALNPIARLRKGSDYLNPYIEIIADDSLNKDAKSKLSVFLNKWLDKHINDVPDNNG